jgi:hypothetical protein
MGQVCRETVSKGALTLTSQAISAGLIRDAYLGTVRCGNLAVSE